MKLGLTEQYICGVLIERMDENSGASRGEEFLARDKAVSNSTNN
jgi:hypothetical protein